MDYVNDWILYQAETPSKTSLMDEIKDVKAIAKIIDEFDGRETVEIKHTHPHSGYLRGIRHIANE